MPFHPYLFFGGNCREAFTRYQEIFGGELFVMDSTDAPGGDQQQLPPGKEHYVLHAAVTFDDHVLMGSDDPMTDNFGPVQGMMISFSTPDAAEAKRVFDALAEGGTVTQPLIETFFSPAWGMVTDRFGTPWMVGADQPAQAAS
jgi:PhnB protein